MSAAEKHSPDRMKLGFVSAILPDLDLAGVLSFAREAGFRVVELMCWPTGKADRRYAGVTHLDVSNFSATDAARVSAWGSVIIRIRWSRTKTKRRQSLATSRRRFPPPRCSE
jgi:hypothetical protein